MLHTSIEGCREQEGSWGLRAGSAVSKTFLFVPYNVQHCLQHQVPGSLLLQATDDIKGKPSFCRENSGVLHKTGKLKG